MRSIGIFIFPGVQALDVTGPADVFAEANAFVPEAERYEVLLVAATADAVSASNGMRILPDAAVVQGKPPLDLFLVPGGPLIPRSVASASVLAAVREAAACSESFGSVCTGAFLLGEAGLLDGRRVTTHWQHAGALAASYPRTDVDPDKIFIRDGDLITSAGVTAGIDLALAIVREHHGARVANAVARRLVVAAQRQGGQSQFSPYAEIAGDIGSPIAAVKTYVMANLRKKLSVAELAAAAGMSGRSFARTFVDRYQITPADFVEQARLEAAKAALESSDAPLKLVAHDCGFRTAKHMSQVFLRRLGMTAAQYRTRQAQGRQGQATGSST
ncbi:GlxA family transcriptional regulator [Rhizobium deserti]|uniref:GlxA family transcriptional regulator n=1 Tax=Rhizobium deserti TaxID=2547961 RepID=A0A4V3APV3_9HYPH|nr:GlxA family transcriptional regulator [Rhizobium deserti]TDK39240.1 GlxA family transcriptional regulator [Rhizobium deserti]